MSHHIGIGCASAIALYLLTGPASAQALTVMPVTVQLQPGQLAATLSISGQNDGRETPYQVRAFAWSQDGNSERLEPTDDLILSPPLGAIRSNATQIVRIVVRHPPQNREAVYRILLDQIPPPSAPGTIRMALRLSLPVFVEPATRIAPHLEWRIEHDADGVWLVAVNDGSRHERLHNILLSAGTATFKPEGDSSPYLLAGVTRRFRLPDDAMPANTAELRLTAQSDSGKIDVLVRSPQKS